MPLARRDRIRPWIGEIDRNRPKSTKIGRDWPKSGKFGPNMRVTMENPAKYSTEALAHECFSSHISTLLSTVSGTPINNQQQQLVEFKSTFLVNLRQGRARTWPSNAASGGKPCAGGPAMLRSSGSGRRGHLTSCHHRRSHRRSQHADGQQAEAKSSGQHWPASPGLRGDRSRQLAEARSASGTWRPRRRRCQRCDTAPPCLEKSCACRP